jgi:hypothetical protein
MAKTAAAKRGMTKRGRPRITNTEVLRTGELKEG